MMTQIKAFFWLARDDDDLIRHIRDYLDKYKPRREDIWVIHSMPVKNALQLSCVPSEVPSRLKVAIFKPGESGPEDIVVAHYDRAKERVICLYQEEEFYTGRAVRQL